MTSHAWIYGLTCISTSLWGRGISSGFRAGTFFFTIEHPAGRCRCVMVCCAVLIASFLTNTHAQSHTVNIVPSCCAVLCLFAVCHR
jgi:hypothetical protein